VRWGLIRVLGELKIQAATALILTDLRNPFHTEYALEALGKIGSDEAYNVIREYVVEHPESAVNALVPLARTGKQRSIRNLRRYLNHEKAELRQAAARGLAAVVSGEALHVLKERLCVEEDEQVRISLFEAVNSLQAVLLPEELVVPAWPAAARARNPELPT
jgi:HEAT repeat protein